MRKILLALILLFAISLPAKAADNRPLLAAGGAGGWLNVTRPLTVADMEGRLVLLDFWTYGCINCMQIIPDLEYLEGKFPDKLLIIGVHSAKFRAEQGSDRILAAAKRFGLKHPVINDSDFAIWRSFNVEAWPTQILLGPDGKEIARYEGEGHRAAIEKDISRHIAAASTQAGMSDIVAKDDSAAPLSFPASLAFDNGLFYVADAGHNRIVAFEETGKIKTVIGSGTRGFKDGSLAEAQFNHPRGLAFLNDVLYIADTGNHAVRAVDLAAQTVATAAGSGKQRDPLSSPWDVEPLADGRTLAIANAGTHQIFSFDTQDKKLKTLAGSGRESIDDGVATGATLAQPSGLSRAGDALFFVDAESSSLRVLEQGKIKTLIGTGLFDFGLADGSYPKAMMQHAQGLFAAGDRILVADTYNNAIRVYDMKTNTLSTLKLSGGELNEPGDIVVVDDTGWVADTNNHAVKKIDLRTGALTTLNLIP